MDDKNMIPAGEFCQHYQVESSFISSLEEYGLIELQVIEETKFIPAELLPNLEKFIHLHYDLNINMEGIDAISHLLARFTSLQNELAALRNRLRIYE
jgi:hypothetical protein